MHITDRLYAHVLACAFFNMALLPAPTKDIFARFSREALFDEWPVSVVTEASLSGLDALRTFFAEYDEEAFAAVLQDHAQLFVGPAGIVPVWESVWTGKDRLLFDEATLAVRAVYATHGLEVSAKDAHPDDHIGYEFAFMGQILMQAIQAASDDDPIAVQTCITAAHSFLHEHLGAWGPDCFAQIAKQAQSPFYRGTAQLGIGYLEELAELLRELEAV